MLFSSSESLNQNTSVSIKLSLAIDVRGATQNQLRDRNENQKSRKQTHCLDSVPQDFPEHILFNEWHGGQKELQNFDEFWLTVIGPWLHDLTRNHCDERERLTYIRHHLGLDLVLRLQ